MELGDQFEHADVLYKENKLAEMVDYIEHLFGFEAHMHNSYGHVYDQTVQVDHDELDMVKEMGLRHNEGGTIYEAFNMISLWVFQKAPYVIGAKKIGYVFFTDRDSNWFIAHPERKKGMDSTIQPTTFDDINTLITELSFLEEELTPTQRAAMNELRTGAEYNNFTNILNTIYNKFCTPSSDGELTVGENADIKPGIATYIDVTYNPTTAKPILAELGFQVQPKDWKQDQRFIDILVQMNPLLDISRCNVIVLNFKGIEYKIHKKIGVEDCYFINYQGYYHELDYVGLMEQLDLIEEFGSDLNKDMAGMFELLKIDNNEMFERVMITFSDFSIKMQRTASMNKASRDFELNEEKTNQYFRPEPVNFKSYKLTRLAMMSDVYLRTMFIMSPDYVRFLYGESNDYAVFFDGEMNLYLQYPDHQIQQFITVGALESELDEIAEKNSFF